VEQRGGVALHLPYGPREIETRGYNLHPYFAGLLPEGMRLKALVRRAKTSEDDMLTLLVAAGVDTIGDLAVAARGSRPTSRAAEIEPTSADQVRFAELWSRVIDGPGDGTPIPGVQEKISPAMISFPVAARSTRAGYILKLEPPDKPRLVENEFFFMRAARAAGVVAAKTWLVRDRDSAPGLLVERFDRRWDPTLRRLVALHVEDGCQLLDRYPADKYAVTCRQLAEALEHTAAPVASRAAFLRLIAFSYVICNGDLHAKNVSVVDSPAGWVFAPSYDLLATLPYGDRSMALSFEGRDKNIRRKHFVAFGGRFGVPERAVASMLDRVTGSVSDLVERLGEIGFEKRREAELARTMAKRAQDLA
jgi:serine/threonine-protein kinase HipA